MLANQPQVRKWIYIVTVVVMTIALGVGVVNPDQMSTVVDNAVKLLGALAAVLAALNVTIPPKE